MSTQKKYRFRIEAYTPESLPMERLAAYLTDLANLFGETPNVHFVALEPGSTTIVQAVDHEAIPKVDRQLMAVRRGGGNPDAMKAYRSTDDRLADDNATGGLFEGHQEVLEFPGRTRLVPPDYGSISQYGSLDGVVMWAGGKDPTVQLDDGENSYRCHTTREAARRARCRI